MFAFISQLSLLFRWSMCLLMPVPFCFDYSSFVVSFEIRNCEYSNFILLFSVLFWLFGGSLKLYINLRISYSISEKKQAIEIFIGIALNLQIPLGSTAILTTLSLPVDENIFPFIQVFFNFFWQCFVVSSVQIFHLKFIPKYFILLNVIVNKVFLILFLVCDHQYIKIQIISVC